MISNLRWLIAAVIFAASAAIHAAPPQEKVVQPSAESALLDAQKLDGVWLVQSAESNRQSCLSQAWTSKITIKAGTFTVSRFCGSSSDLHGTFALDTSAATKAFNLTVEAIDLSEIWEGVKYPKCTILGIYKLDDNALTVCFQTSSQTQRPSDFVSRDRSTFVLSFVRADPNFKGFPKDMTVVVTDPAGKPAAGASVFRFMSLSHVSAKKESSPAWKYFEIAKTGPDGSARVAYDVLAYCPAAARDIERKLTGFASVSPASSMTGTVNVILRPECQVSGKIVCDELTNRGKPLGWTNAYLLYGGQRIGECDVTTDGFEFPVPPGSYTLDLYGTSLRHKQVDVTIPEGRADFQIQPPVSLVASKLAWLEGQPAPELEGVVGWRGEPVKLADLKGKYVLIDFWGYWCGPCVQAMPVLIALDERFKDKGLAIIGVHCDMDGEVSTPAILEEKLAPIKKNLWQGKDLPFPVALTTKEYMDSPQSTSRSTAAQYGILGYPTTILIDKEGKVVGQFQARDEKEAVAEVEKLLKTDR